MTKYVFVPIISKIKLVEEVSVGKERTQKGYPIKSIVNNLY